MRPNGANAGTEAFPAADGTSKNADLINLDVPNSSDGSRENKMTEVDTEKNMTRHTSPDSGHDNPNTRIQASTSWSTLEGVRPPSPKTYSRQEPVRQSVPGDEGNLDVLKSTGVKGTVSNRAQLDASRSLIPPQIGSSSQKSRLSKDNFVQTQQMLLSNDTHAKANQRSFCRLLDQMVLIEGFYATKHHQQRIELLKRAKMWHPLPQDAIRATFMFGEYDAQSMRSKGQLLYLACYVGEIDIVQAALDRGADPDYLVEQLADCPLQVAIGFDHTNIIALLIREKATMSPWLKFRQKSRESYIRCNIQLMSSATIAVLRRNIWKSDFPRDILLLLPTFSDSLENLALFIRNDYDRTVRDEVGNTCLHIAAENSRHRIVESLARTASLVNSINHKGQSPLHVATNYGDAKTVEILIEAKAEVNQVDVNGETPLHVLARGPHTDEKKKPSAHLVSCMRFKLGRLRTAGAAHDMKNKWGQQPLHVAIKFGPPILVQQFLWEGADSNAMDKDGYCPLHYCVIYGSGHPQIARMLLEAGADRTRKSNTAEQWPPYRYAKWKGNQLLYDALKY